MKGKFDSLSKNSILSQCPVRIAFWSSMWMDVLRESCAIYRYRIDGSHGVLSN